MSKSQHLAPVNRLGAFVLIAAVVAAAPARAQTADNVAVVVNDESPVSQRIADYYVRKRAIPGTHVLRIRTAPQERIERADYVSQIEAPIAAALTRAGLQDRVLYLVLTKGVPLRINGTGQATGTQASVDSELTLLYRRMTGQQLSPAGRIDNPYYLAARDLATLAPFSHRQHDIFLVTRLDAFTEKEVFALIDRGSAPVRDGRIVLDQQDRLVNRTGEEWLAAAARRLSAQGESERVLLESTVKGVRDVASVLGYFSWGGNDPRNRARKLNLGFVPGALAATFASSDARTFQEPPATWVPTEGSASSTRFADSGQTLIGDLIREGATGVAGQVAEPFLESSVRPEILFPAYLGGANLAEAFYAAIPHLSWQTVVIGDPLCAPFRQKSLTRSELESPVDDVTLLPGLFASRRLAVTTKAWPGASPKAIGQLVRGEVLLARGDVAAGRVALETATAESPQLSGAQLQLALFFDQAGQFDAAIDRYRKVIAHQPNNAVALNNLAYRLAVDRNAAAEALVFAARAAKLAPQDATVLDTLAWVQHLLGDDAAAAKTMAAALKHAPQHPEIRLHAAVIYAALGVKAVAEEQLKEAIRLDPSLAEGAVVAGVRRQLERLGTSK